MEIVKLFVLLCLLGSYGKQFNDVLFIQTMQLDLR